MKQCIDISTHLRVKRVFPFPALRKREREVLIGTFITYHNIRNPCKKHSCKHENLTRNTSLSKLAVGAGPGQGDWCFWEGEGLVEAAVDADSSCEGVGFVGRTLNADWCFLTVGEVPVEARVALVGHNTCPVSARICRRHTQ